MIKWNKKLMLIALVFIVAACKTTQLPVEVPILTNVKIVERLVPVEAPADSANIVALFECDSLNQVIMKSLDEQKSQNVKSRFSYNTGMLRYNFATAPAISFATVRDSIVYREVAVKVPVEVKVNELTWWQKLWITIGKISAALGLIILVVFIVKSKFSLNGHTSLFR